MHPSWLTSRQGAGGSRSGTGSRGTPSDRGDLRAAVSLPCSVSSFLDSEAGGRCLLLILTGVKEQVRTSNLGSADIQQCLLNVLYMLETNGK